MKTAAEILIEHGIDLKSSAPGRYYTTCPQCSAMRSKPHRGNKVLGITIDRSGVQWGCNHCEWTGGGYYNGKANGHAHSDFVATYDYFDESGALLFQVCRRADKSFPQRRPDGKGGWAWGTKDVRKVLYRLPETVEAIAAGHMILVVEGEKDANAAWRIGLPATCNPGGASEHGQKPKWRQEFSESLRGADVVIVPDNDEPGYAHAKSIANSLAGIAKRVRVLKLADHWREVAAKRGGDLSDGLAAGHTREELDALIEQTPEFEANPASAVHSMEVLKTMIFEPVKYVVPGIIVEGLTILAGKPKLGKSWLMLHAGVAVARGGFTLGEIHCIEGDVLYCALEDNQRRLQSRMTKLLGIARPWPKRMQYLCMGEMPRLNAGGLDMIRDWIKSVPEPRLIMIDTFATVRAPKKNNEPHYDADYESGKALQALASEFGVAIVIVHHLRKADADDVFDTVSGTLGLTGVVDTILILKRDSKGGFTLHGHGRDLEALEKAIVWNADACTWTLIGDAKTVRRSSERAAILEALAAATEPLAPSDIAAAAEMKAANVKVLLGKMLENGEVAKAAYGKYQLRRVTVEAAE